MSLHLSSTKTKFAFRMQHKTFLKAKQDNLLHLQSMQEKAKNDKCTHLHRNVMAIISTQAHGRERKTHHAQCRAPQQIKRRPPGILQAKRAICPIPPQKPLKSCVVG